MNEELRYRDEMIEYIKNEFKSVPHSETLYNFERILLDSLCEKADRLIYAGLRDKKVLIDILASEHPNLIEEFKQFEEQEAKRIRERKLHRRSLIASLAAIPAIILIYLAVSFITKEWSISWLIVVGGVFAVVIYLLGLSISKLTTMKRLYQGIARIMLAGCVMLASTFAFLFVLMLFDPGNSWVILPAGVFLIYVADAIYARITKQPLRIINYLVYVPAAMPMIYIVICGLGLLPWHPIWIIVPLSVVIDILIVIGKLIERSKYVYKREDEDE